MKKELTVNRNMHSRECHTWYSDQRWQMECKIEIEIDRLLFVCVCVCVDKSQAVFRWMLSICINVKLLFWVSIFCSCCVCRLFIHPDEMDWEIESEGAGAVSDIPNQQNVINRYMAKKLISDRDKYEYNSTCN